MGIFQIITSLVVGLVVGLIARLIIPGAQNISWFATAIYGISGSYLGGFLGSLINKPADGAKFHPAGFLMSIVGTVVVLLVAGQLFRF